MMPADISIPRLGRYCPGGPGHHIIGGLARRRRGRAVRPSSASPGRALRLSWAFLLMSVGSDATPARGTKCRESQAIRLAALPCNNLLALSVACLLTGQDTG